MEPTYDQVHARRFAISLEWIAPLLKDAAVLEFGDPTTFSQMVINTGLIKSLAATTHDLRKRCSSIQSDTYDLVLCMEVIEHIADREGRNAEWTGSGANCLLAEAFRVLKPGGRLFLTTPNAASVTIIHKALLLAPPMLYRPHVREYAPYELDEIVRAAGFIINDRQTLDVWMNAISAPDHDKLFGFIRDFYPLTDPGLRGEDIFMIASKPIPKPEPEAEQVPDFGQPEHILEIPQE